MEQQQQHHTPLVHNIIENLNILNNINEKELDSIINNNKTKLLYSLIEMNTNQDSCSTTSSGDKNNNNSASKPKDDNNIIINKSPSSSRSTSPRRNSIRGISEKHASKVAAALQAATNINSSKNENTRGLPKKQNSNKFTTSDGGAASNSTPGNTPRPVLATHIVSPSNTLTIGDTVNLSDLDKPKRKRSNLKNIFNVDTSSINNSNNKHTIQGSYIYTNSDDTSSNNNTNTDSDTSSFPSSFEGGGGGGGGSINDDSISVVNLSSKSKGGNDNNINHSDEDQYPDYHSSKKSKMKNKFSSVGSSSSNKDKITNEELLRQIISIKSDVNSMNEFIQNKENESKQKNKNKNKNKKEESEEEEEDDDDSNESGENENIHEESFCEYYCGCIIS